MEADSTSSCFEVRWLIMAWPLLLQPLCLLFGDGSDGTVLGRYAAVHLHTSFAESAKRGEGLEVSGLHESEVVGSDAEDVVHEEPAVFADELVHRGRLAGTVLAVNLLGLILSVLIINGC